MARNDWFAPKRFGYGAGLPIAWQGWALLVAFLTMLGADMTLVTPRGLASGIAIALILAFAVIAARHTRGGWRWRWGRD